MKSGRAFEVDCSPVISGVRRLSLAKALVSPVK
jgi:hypothetical protein